MNLLQVLIKGGWLMIPIALSSLVVVALGVSRWLTLNRARRELLNFASNWEHAPTAVDASRFRAACKIGPDVAAAMANILEEAALLPAEASGRLESTAQRELAQLESGLGAIATLAAITPLLGFLGTVTGMIKAFMQIQNLGGNVNANVLAGGIWEALVTTAAGLAVGILALLVYNYLAGIIKDLARGLENCGDIIIRILGRRHEA
ncbi:MAG: MotA/TolQ/ExbB proton channel family protein [Calditrichota bacterium]